MENKSQHDYIYISKDLMKCENCLKKAKNVTADTLNKCGEKTERKEEEKQSSLDKLNVDVRKLALKYNEAMEGNEGNSARLDKTKQLLENSLEPPSDKSSSDEEVFDVDVRNIIAVGRADVNSRSCERLKIDVGSIAKRFTSNENKPVVKLRSIQSLKDLNIGFGSIREKFNANEDEIKEFLPVPNPKEDKKTSRVITSPRGFSS